MIDVHTMTKSAIEQRNGDEKHALLSKMRPRNARRFKLLSQLWHISIRAHRKWNKNRRESMPKMWHNNEVRLHGWTRFPTLIMDDRTRNLLDPRRRRTHGRKNRNKSIRMPPMRIYRTLYKTPGKGQENNTKRTHQTRRRIAKKLWKTPRRFSWDSAYSQAHLTNRLQTNPYSKVNSPIGDPKTPSDLYELPWLPAIQHIAITLPRKRRFTNPESIESLVCFDLTTA